LQIELVSITGTSVAPRLGSDPAARFFATAAKGTEALLADELGEIGLPLVRPSRGGVHFGKEAADAYLACLWSRIALRIHEPLASFECRNADDLYAGVGTVDWSRFLGAERTLAVRAAGTNALLTHTHFIAVRAKDAIVDQLRDSRGFRPSVDRDDPDLLLFVHLVRDRATIHLDYSGGSLHAHGFRSREGVAPLRETLAAALVRFSGWSGDVGLVDPMCGSGTLLLEAGLWAARRAPGLSRDRFGFERWSSFDSSAREKLATLRGEARAKARPAPPLFGSDTDPRALEQTRANALKAGLAVELVQQPVAAVDPRGQAGGLLMNPPYGQRLARSADLDRDVDNALSRFSSHQRALIVTPDFPSRARPSRSLAVYNGAIECELRRYDAERSSTLREPPAQPPAPGPRRITFRPTPGRK
jgi:23S rRNA G2445 N2-methylase RlmL